MGICEDAPDEYCGHILTPEHREPDSEWHKKMRNAVCLREPAYDGLCVWHTDSEKKSVEELSRSRLVSDNQSDGSKCKKRHISGAKLQNIRFPEGFSFRKCILIQADFSNSSLHNAIFCAADLREAKFSNTHLSQASFRDAWLQEAEFSDADLINADLRSADLRYAELPDANFHSADCRDANFAHTTLTNAKLNSTDMSCTLLRNSNIAEAKIQEADFSAADLAYSDLSGKELSRTDLSRSVLRHCDLSNVQMTNSDLSEADIIGATMNRTDLKRADLSGAVLEDAVLTNADIRHADFTDAQLYQADLSGARVGPTTDFGAQTSYENMDSSKSGVGIYNEQPNLIKAEWVYKHLQSLYQDKHMKNQLSRYYYRMKESQRKYHRSRLDHLLFQSKYISLTPIKLLIRHQTRYAILTGDKLLMSYGQDPLKLIIYNLCIIILFGILYPFIGGVQQFRSEANSKNYSLNIEISFDSIAQLFQFNWTDEIIVGVIYSANQFSTAVSIGAVDVSVITGQLIEGQLQPSSEIVRIVSVIESIVGGLLLTLLGIWLLRRINSRIS